MKAVLNRCSGPDAHYLIPEEFLDAERGAFEALGSPAAVEFYFDAHERKIGVKACVPDARYAFKVSKDRMSYIIHADSFCRHNLIKTNRRVLFEDPEIRRDQMLVLDLAKTINVSRSFGPKKELRLEPERQKRTRVFRWIKVLAANRSPSDPADRR